MRSVIALVVFLTGVAAAQEKLVIVSIGDSSASGEGNPPWQASVPVGPMLNHPRLDELAVTDERCHRSQTAAPRIAARRLQERYPGVPIEFTSFACSGAKVENLIDTEQLLPVTLRMGIQLDMVKSFYDGKRIDALVINVGINDVGFAEMVGLCATNFTPFWGQDRCYKDAYAKCPSGQYCPTKRAAELAGNYDRLMRRITELGLDVGNLYLTEYPAAVQDDSGAWCDHQPNDDFLRGISSDESQWTQNTAVKLLNEQGALLTDPSRPTPPGYHHVVGVVDAFNGHGFCANNRFVRTMNDANSLGNPNGILHPNGLGHEAWAQVFLPYLDPVVPPVVPHVAAASDVGTVRLLWTESPRATFYQLAWRRVGLGEALTAPGDPEGVLGNPPRLLPDPMWTVVSQTAPREWSLPGTQVVDVAVRACTSDACSRWSEARRLDNTLPTAPIHLRPTPTQLGFEISWESGPQRAPVTSYVVGWHAAGSVKHYWQYRTVTEPRVNVALGSNDVFVRSCFNVNLCSPWSGLRVSSERPAAPTRLRFGSQLGQAVGISWEDRSRNETHFEVAFLRYASEPYVYEREIDNEDSWYHLFNAAPSWVWVRACGDLQCSAWSDGIRFFGPVAPPPPPDTPIAPRPTEQPGPTPPPPL